MHYVRQQLHLLKMMRDEIIIEDATLLFAATSIAVVMVGLLADANVVVVVVVFVLVAMVGAVRNIEGWCRCQSCCRRTASARSL